MIDEENRPKKRFPPDLEDKVKEAIKKEVLNQKKLSDLPLFGIAGGACGGDILFHEVCREFQIPTKLFLALPKEKFVQHSINFAGKSWRKRFENLLDYLPVEVFSDEKSHCYIEASNETGLWELNNLWLLNYALKNSKSTITLIALWDEKISNKVGGTEHMVREAKAKAIEIKIINPTSLINKK